MDTNILLEQGTNELEVLEFTLGGHSYGINVAKVREILPSQKVTPIPSSHESIEGIFMPRDMMITVINLKKSLSIADDGTDGQFIITNFNKLHIAFRVDSVIGIHRLSWESIIKPDSTLSDKTKSTSTGFIKMDDKIIVILDFEKIVSDINPETGLKFSDIEQIGQRDRNEVPILIAEDSPLLNKLIKDALIKSGYSNIIATSNGLEAWEYINKAKVNKTLDKYVQCVITDIEMPQMDGHRLTKLIKSDDQLKQLPVVIFSSLVNDEMRRKGELLGANAQLSKPEIGNLVNEIDKLLRKSK